jgi:hypothetical protein
MVDITRWPVAVLTGVDAGSDREKASGMFTFARNLRHSADLGFGQLESGCRSKG